MVKGRGSMALAGPHLVKAAVGEDVTQEELGGSRVHTRKSGVGDMEVVSDEECIEAIKAYLSYMPQNCEEAPPVRAASDPIDRREEALLDVLAGACMIQPAGPGRFTTHDLLRGYARELAASQHSEPEQRAALERLFDRLATGKLGGGATLSGCRLGPAPRRLQAFGPQTLVLARESSRKLG